MCFATGKLFNSIPIRSIYKKLTANMSLLIIYLVNKAHKMPVFFYHFQAYLLNKSYASSGNRLLHETDQ